MFMVPMATTPNSQSQIEDNERLIMNFFFLTLFFSPLALSIEAMDNYYSNDLIDAVDTAKEKPHHYDYSNNYRYKRTTAQSIQLNQLNLDELESAQLSINSKSIESKPNINEQENLVLNEQEGPYAAEKNYDDFKAYSPSLPNNSHSSTQYGSSSINGIRGGIDTTITIETRP